MIHSLLFPRVWVLLGFLYEPTAAQKFKFLKMSLGFPLPDETLVHWHRIWQPVREAKGFAAKFASLFYTVVCRSGGWTRYRQAQIFFMWLAVLSLLTVIALGVTYNFVDSNLLLIPAFLHSGVTILLIILLVLLGTGRDSSMVWERKTFQSSTRKVFAVQLDIPWFARERMDQVDRTAGKIGVEKLAFTIERTKIDPIITAKFQIDGKDFKIPIAVYDLYDRRPMFE
jgi:hypothetical protein